jgi:hypothetical protein
LGPHDRDGIAAAGFWQQTGFRLTFVDPPRQLTLERVPIRWNHLIDKDAAQKQRGGMLESKKASNFFERHALGPVDIHLRANCRGRDHGWVAFVGFFVAGGDGPELVTIAKEVLGR